MYLITKWFGTFLCDKKGVKYKILFSKDLKVISKKIQQTQNNIILNEEKKIIKNVKDVIVNEKRLKTLGSYNPSDPFFKKGGD